MMEDPYRASYDTYGQPAPALIDRRSITRPSLGDSGGYVATGPVVTSPRQGSCEMYSSGRPLGSEYVQQGSMAGYSTTGYRQVEALSLQKAVPIEQGYTMQYQAPQAMNSSYTSTGNASYEVYDAGAGNYKAEYHVHQQVPMQVQAVQMMPMQAMPMQQVVYSPPRETYTATQAFSPPRVETTPPKKKVVAKQTQAAQMANAPEVITIEREVPIFNEISVPIERVVEKFEEIQVDRIRFEDQFIEVERLSVMETPVTIEKLVVKEVRVPFDVEVEYITFRDVVTEVPVETVVINEIQVTVERIVIREVPVPIERIVEKTVVKDVMVERVVVKEVPVPIEKITVRDVPVPVENIVERTIEKQVERIIYQDRIVHQDKIVYQDKVVYQDRIVEVPVDRQVHGAPVAETQINYSSMREVYGVKVGLGLVLRRNEEGRIFIKEIIHGFAAQRQGGVEPGDILVQVDDKLVDGFELDDIKHLTVGDIASYVTLTIRRAGADFTVQLQRVANEESQMLTGSRRSATGYQ
mmetsp:Transcript_11067/g.25909  ORF Transcript_11067/g.25909 Transcript_11067/m.25909 type:complete len:523 (+) Transcript_11067:19-1587(+)